MDKQQNFRKRYCSPLGNIVISSDGEAVTELRFSDEDFTENEDLPVLRETEKWLDIYFSDGVPGFTPKLSPGGTLFQKKVWKILLEIPYGQKMSYKEIAEKIRTEEKREHMSAQAVGGAVAKNPILLIIPCHRVTGNDGSLTGYSAGLERKRKLLEKEKIMI